jgi:hypothetical protein
MGHITTWEEDYKGNNTSPSLQSSLANSSSPSCTPHTARPPGPTYIQSALTLTHCAPCTRHQTSVHTYTLNINVTHYACRLWTALRLPQQRGSGNYLKFMPSTWAGLARSVQCLTTGWTTGRSRFDPRHRRKDFSFSLCVQTGSEAHPASCTMGPGGPFPGVKRGWGVTLTTHPHLVRRSRMSRSYTSFPPKRLSGV